MFEYIRADGYKRCVAAYADRHGERVFYRFIRHGFEVKQFVTAENELVRAADLLHRHLKLIEGYEYAERQVETTADYRNIIQGVPSNSTNRQHQQVMRHMALEYSLTDSRHPLRQIEKIVSGMFRRKTNFDDLQGMVIDCVTDDEQLSHELSGDRRKIESWPKDYRAYTTVMAEAENMATVLQDEEKLHALEQALAELGARFTSLGGYIQMTSSNSKNPYYKNKNSYSIQKVKPFKINAHK